MSERAPALTASDDDEILAAARVGFLDEAQQMLAQFEEALLILEDQPGDDEHLNAAFRAAHTIKGTAGLFGYDAVVAFTHEVETVMEALRSQALAVDETIIALLLASRDQMARLLAEVDRPQPTEATQQQGLQLGQQLRALLQPGGAASAAAAAAVSATTAPAASTAEPGDAAGAAEPARDAGQPWWISLRFGRDALRNGLDPLAFIRYLDQVGEVQDLLTLGEAVPALAELDAEDCHLGFEIALVSTADRATIEAVFEFVVEDCDILILEPDRVRAEGQALLASRCPGNDTDTDTDAESLDLLTRWWAAQDWAPIAIAAILPPAPPPPAQAVAAPAPAPAPETAERRGAAPRRQDDTKFIRVRADKLDLLIDLIGELVIASSGAQLAAQIEGSERFSEAANRIGGLVEEARNGALALRMVPIGETFSRFQRVVRDVSKQLGKEVELQISGGDTELDKTMVETIADPLLHLVRNSLDHGIESAADRQAAGKPARGRLGLHAYHEQGQIFIEVSDDGRGLHRDRILTKAIERGLVPADVQLSDHEVHQLICLPGFSTAEQVTDLSGRGVGMDVVKRNIETLRGHFQIASRPGLGSTMQIRLPLTLAIIDGFLTQVGDVHYIVPLEMVEECIETPPGWRGRELADDGPSSGYLDLRDEILPFLDLRRHFGIPGPRPARMSMLVVQGDHGKVGLLVDRLLGKYQTVIKPLGRLLRDLRCVAGSTVLGSGEVGLVLDLPALLEGVRRLPAGHAPPLLAIGGTGSGSGPGAAPTLALATV